MSLTKRVGDEDTGEYLDCPLQPVAGVAHLLLLTPHGKLVSAGNGPTLSANCSRSSEELLLN
jgi:hypothetical protein